MKIYETRLRINYKCLAVCAKFNAIPCKFSESGRQVTFGIVRWRSSCWRFQFYFSLMYCLYINLRLVERILWPTDFKYYELGTHISRAFLATPFIHWAYEIFLKHPLDEQVLYNYAQSGPSREGKMSLQDVLLISIPATLYPFCFFYAAIFLWDSSPNQFLYATIPVLHSLDSMLIKVAFAVLEAYMFFMWMAFAHFEVFLSITFMQKVKRDLASNAQTGKSAGGRNEWESWMESLKEGYRAAKCAHLGVSLFNTCNSGVVFSQKLLCLCGSVLSMYLFIALVRVVPLVSGMFVFLFINGNLFYSLVWGGAYEIPSNLNKLLRHLRAETSRMMIGRDLDYYKRALESVPSFGLKAGSFRHIERNSRLLFVDFVVNNVAMMLISFREHY